MKTAAGILALAWPNRSSAAATAIRSSSPAASAFSFPGNSRLFYDEGGLGTNEVMLEAVHPQEPVTPHQAIVARKKIARVSIHLMDSSGLDRGALGEVFVTIYDEGH